MNSLPLPLNLRKCLYIMVLQKVEVEVIFAKYFEGKAFLSFTIPLVSVISMFL